VPVGEVSLESVASYVLRVFIVTKVKEITEASASVGLLLATAVPRRMLENRLSLHLDQMQAF